MLADVVTVQPLAHHRLLVTLDDGRSGEVDVADLIEFTGIFEPLRDRAFFSTATVYSELGVVFWPNGADLDSDVLHAHVVRAQAGPTDSSA